MATCDNGINNINNSDKFTPLSVLVDYAPLVKSRALLFLSSGCELEDLIQEGSIGLYSASLTYNCELSTFGTFARRCIDSAIIDYLRRMQKASSIPNELFVDIDDIEVADNYLDVEYFISVKDEYSSLREKALKCLSAFEFTVFTDLLRGYQQKEIAIRNKTELKSVHNAVQRIRTKLK